MKTFIKIGRAFYGAGVTVFGIQQLIIKDFRPEILPPFPAWAHQNVLLPILTGIILIVVGLVITGLFQTKKINTKKVCLYLGSYFLLLIIICHLPYTLIFSPNKLSHLGVWAQALKELAFCGGAFVMAGSFAQNIVRTRKPNVFELVLEKFIPLGRVFFSTTMILYGCSHFVYIDYVSLMVPKWFGMPVFWTYFGGIALMGSGIAIILKVWIKPIAILLAIMLFLWFIFLHVPNAITNFYSNNGNEVVSAFDALMFCGTALVIAFTNLKK
jgi:uncharacterized membrane protein YphA (DoxX/SURF4 family)